ncbi:hypothetical protein L4D76_24470 [Photobacterium sagamiensis]|uniref:hypothetical protein n=1 Tax=Photobacterium sagamiensis TaxID=2910241 RepID=UPI003D136102
MCDEEERQQRYQEWKANKDHPVGSEAFLTDHEYDLLQRDEAWKEEHEKRVQKRLDNNTEKTKLAYTRMKGHVTLTSFRRSLVIPIALQ